MVIHTLKSLLYASSVWSCLWRQLGNFQVVLHAASAWNRTTLWKAALQSRVQSSAKSCRWKGTIGAQFGHTQPQSIEWLLSEMFCFEMAKTGPTKVATISHTVLWAQKTQWVNQAMESVLFRQEWLTPKAAWFTRRVGKQVAQSYTWLGNNLKGNLRSCTGIWHL